MGIIPFLLITFVFVLMLIAEAESQVIPSLTDTSNESFLISEDTKRVFSSICLSLIAAYIFYIFIDFIPSKRSKKNSLKVLNTLIKTVLSTYKNKRIFGHSIKVTDVDKTCLEQKWLDDTLLELYDHKPNLALLVITSQAAQSRLQEFRALTSVAASISPNRALLWIHIIDKTKLLSEALTETYDNDEMEKNVYV